MHLLIVLLLAVFIMSMTHGTKLPSGRINYGRRTRRMFR